MPSSRFLVWDKPLAYPFYDLINRDTAPGPVFDLNVEMQDYNGRVYIATPHIIEMAQSLGMATIDEVAEMRAEIAELKKQINRLPNAQENLKSGIDSLVSEFLSDLRNDKPDVPVPVEEPELDTSFLDEDKREAIGSIGF